MSTTLVKPAEVERKWYLLDATGKSLGHVAAEAAVLLRGREKTILLLHLHTYYMPSDRHYWDSSFLLPHR